MKRILYASAAALALGAYGAQAQDLVFTPGEGGFNWQSYTDFAAAHDLTGQTVSVSGPWLSGDRDLVNSVFAYFEAATGATVEYAGSDSFEAEIRRSAQTGGLPNIAVIPQPGLLADLARDGVVAPCLQQMPPGSRKTMPLVRPGLRWPRARTRRRVVRRSTGSSTRSM